MEVSVAPSSSHTGSTTASNVVNMPPKEAPSSTHTEPQQEDNQTEQPQETPEYAIKHPLQNRWVLWYDNPGKKTNQDSWADNLKKIVTFDTVEDFWRVYNNIQPASVLSSGSNYHLFKDGIEPKWEDPINQHGGKWVISIPTKNRNEALDKLWLWMMLGCIGESLEDGNEVCGVVVSIRKAQDRLAVWTRDATNEPTVRNIGRKIKAVLELPDTVLIGYQSHTDAMKRGSSFNNKNKYEV
jgi:translation initiation factor 4E